MKKAKKEGKKVKLVRDKLYINGKPHVSLDTKPNGTEYRGVLLRQAQQNSHRNKTVNERPFKRSRQESGNNDAINEETITTPMFSKCLLVGDFNARTGSEDDFIFVPDSESHVVDIENIQINAVCNLDQYDFSRKRNSRDKNKNRFGNQLIEFCKGNNFFIMNGRTLGDIDGKFTCRNSSVVDYCLCSAELIQNFTDFKVHDFSSLYSDVHSPIEISLKQTDQEVSTKYSDDTRTNEQKIKNWTNEKSHKFLECLNLTEIENINSEIDGTTVVTQETHDMLIGKIGKVLINSARNTFGFKVSAGKKSEQRTNKPWFDHDCKAAREELFVKGEFGSSNGPILLERLSCTGNENDIAGCLLNWKSANCTGQGAVGIRCGTSPIRLVGGGGPWEGRVEVMHNGQWGTVCDTGFGNEEAQVVCKMLGFRDGTTDAYAKNTSFYGPSDKTIYLDQLSCTGTELDINGCRTKEWGYRTCDNNHEAGVLCKATNVRLSGGSHTMEGRVEIMKDGTWSTLCDDGWVDNEATIICKMLTPYPLNRLIYGKAFTESYFGEGSGVASLSNLKCNGTEVDLLHCSMNKDGRPHCDHSHDAGVSCSLNSTSYIVGTNNNQGTLQTQIANFAGTICGINVQDIAGSVICKSLGYWMNTATLFKNSWFGPGNGMSFNLQPECSGKETNIVFCRLKNTFGKINCDHSNDVGVKCTSIPLGLNNIRLALGNSKGDGRLEIKYNNKWGTVCSEDWTLKNSKAVCTMLGYQNRTFQTNAIKRNNSAVVLGSLNCMGFENDIGFCKGGLDKSNCTDDIVNIDCTGGMQMKLSGGSSPAEGRVDILDNGQWGSLCDRSFGIAELQVMCSMLGYRNTLPYLYHLPSLKLHRSAFGIDQLTCSGLEDHIAQCPFSTIASCHHKYAHLKCFDCVQQYYSTTGNIMSDNYPGRYNPNTDCLYIIQPPSGLYRLTIDVLQMADTGDFLQIKESPFGKELGYYSVSSYIPVALSEQFWIRFKMNGQRSARGFKLHWSPLDFKDQLSLNCELSRWGAAINITLLHMANISVNYSDIYMTDPDCFGKIVGDKLLFNQLYDECGSTKNVSHFYFTYHNNITFISEGVVHEIPLECQLFKDDRIIHYHNVDGRNELDDESYNGLEGSLFHIELYYDSELTETKDKQFKGKFVYKIATEKGSYSPHPLLNNCFISVNRNGTEEKMRILENTLPKLDSVKVRYLGNDVMVLEVLVPENVPSYLECNVAWT
ncbi:unnamed protein product [Mytilus edulis]|uniref:Uncharacterized protein n=1 Tax=Mytilus edulis TaxID=6550 RepID=A0A8S3QMN0_MYTED|nr:unnamed protein product [Mytilus edulis]